MTDASKVPARRRLLEMPEVFSVAELALVMGVKRTEASQYLWRWKASELVAPFGGKSGIFFNLVLAPGALSDALLWQRALLKTMPSSIIGGWEVLAESGLTTQITHQHYVLISNTDAKPLVDGAEVHRRPVPWLNRLAREGAVLNPKPGMLVPRLRPGAALADLTLFSPRKPDPDDIDLEMADADEMELLQRLLQPEASAEVASKRRPAPR